MAEKSIINTFEKGLHRDSSFILQPDGTYRNMKNGMLISHDGNHFVIEISKGNRIILTLPPRYHSNVSNYTSKDVYPMAIGFISFIDKLAVFFTNNDGSGGGYGEIGLISFTRVNGDFVASYTPYYHHPSLMFTRLHKIEGFSFEENDNIERVYWTDYFNEPRVFDFANPLFTNYIPSGSLVNGKTYMILQGVISYNSAYYGPSDDSSSVVQAIPYVNSNIFVANATTTFTVIDGTPLIIEYYPMSLLDWIPSRTLGNIKYKEYGTGNKYCGNNIYFYRLSSSSDGVATSWSYGSNPIHVGMDNESAYTSGDSYRDFVGNGSETTLENSGKSVKITISNIDLAFDTLEVAVAEYDQITDIPYIIKIIAKAPITDDEMEVEDLGTINLGEVTLSDLTLFPANILKIKTLTTNKNFIVIANTTEREEFDLDLTGVTATPFQYLMNSHGDIGTTSCESARNVFTSISPTPSANPGAGDIQPYTRWFVTNGAASVDTVIYNGVTYLTGEIITGVTADDTITFAGAGAVRPCTTRNRYTTISGGDRIEDAIELKSAFWDYKDPAVASHNKGYWSGEKYRFGILFYDLKGNPYYVKWLKDVDMPLVTDAAKGGLMDKTLNASGTYMYSLKATGVNISDLDIPESVMNKISGFSIVRAERDGLIISQGLLMQNVINTGVSPDRVMPSCFTRTDGNIYPNYTDGICSVLCPDDLVGYDFGDFPVGVLGQEMKEAFWVEGNMLKTEGNGSQVGNFQSMVTKMFDLSGGDGKDSNSPRTFELTDMNGNGSATVDEGQALSDFDGSGRNYLNAKSDAEGAYINSNADTYCSADPAGDQGPYGVYAPLSSKVESIGCKKRLIKSTFPHFGSSDDYNSTTTGTIHDKIIANYINDKDVNSLYGGNSDLAKANTLYMSTGHFQPITTQVKADTLNGVFSGGDYDGENKYTFNDIEIFGGDCFTCLIDIGYGSWDETRYAGGNNVMAYAMWFPCECNANYNLRRGLKASNKGMYPFGLLGFDTPAGPQLENYSYNLGYSSDGTLLKYPALPINYKFSGRFPWRTRFAGEKYSGELEDSFRKFLINDYKDLDGKLGEINNVKSKDGRTLVWQNHGVSSVPILERQLLSGTDGAVTNIGTGGVIDRFDPISSDYGNQHQHGLTETEFGYMWFDMRNRALCIMGSDGGIQEISLIKGLQVFFNSEFNEGNIFYPNVSYNIYNTTDLSIPEAPLLGWGIIGAYDPKFKMSYLTFKYQKQDLIDVEDETISLAAKDFTIGYCHVNDTIVGFYDFCPANIHNHNDLLLSVNDSKNRVYYGDNMVATNFVVGDTIRITDNVTASKNGEYVCIKDLTVASYPATGIYEPTYASSIYWVKTNDQSQVYIHTFGSDYLKFYGKVHNHELEIIVNPKADVSFSAQHVQMKGNNVNYTDVYVSNDALTASDINIRSTSRFHRFIDGAWFFSLPLSEANGRLTDYYAKVKFVYKGYVTNPTVSKNVNKVVQWIQTFLTPKR